LCERGCQSDELATVWCLFDGRLLVKAEHNDATSTYNCSKPFLDAGSHSVLFGVAGGSRLPTDFSSPKIFAVEPFEELQLAQNGKVEFFF
jgi:hypothetical protein